MLPSGGMMLHIYYYEYIKNHTVFLRSAVIIYSSKLYAEMRHVMLMDVYRASLTYRF